MENPKNKAKINNDNKPSKSNLRGLKSFTKKVFSAVKNQGLGMTFKKLSISLKTRGFKGTISKAKNKYQDKESALKSGLSIYKYDYEFESEKIPDEWVLIQKYQPKIAVLALGKDEFKADFLESMDSQNYKNFNIYFENINITEDYIVVMDMCDIADKNALSLIVECINLKGKPYLIYADYDNFEVKGKFHTHIKKDYIKYPRLNCIKRGIFAVKNENITEIDEKINSILENKLKIYHIDKVLVHRRITKGDSGVRFLTFYLPQFHAIAENNEWWGKGFTEWVNVKRAKPMFKGHDQERKPADLAYYDLINTKDIQKKQAEMAKKHGIHGFCYYYYWFNGKRLLEKPMDNIIKDKSIDLPFCICWANENWTKRWDGMESKVLMEQVHEKDSDERFIDDIMHVIKDERYITVNGKPLVLIYRIDKLENGKETIETWRNHAKKHGTEIYIAVVKHEGVVAKNYGADALVEFPPHDMNPKEITMLLDEVNPDFHGAVYDYSELANRSDGSLFEDETVFRAAMMKWDNTARRMEGASVFHNFSPDDYKRWLLKVKEYECLFNEREEKIVFINAWNEWAEGTYLEPDETHGSTLLEITKLISESR